MRQRSPWSDYLSAAVRTGAKLTGSFVPGVSFAVDVIEKVEERREAEAKHGQTLAEISRVERSVVEVIEREMKAVLGRLHTPNLSHGELEEEIANLYSMREYGREPFLCQGLLANSQWYDQLCRTPNLYGRVLQDNDIPRPECFYLFIDADKSRLLEISPYAVQQLLSGQARGTPTGELVGTQDLFAARLKTPAAIPQPPAPAIRAPAGRSYSTPPQRSLSASECDHQVDLHLDRLSTNPTPDATATRTTTRTAPEPFAGHEQSIECLACSPDGRHVSTSDGQTVRTWDMLTGREVLCISEPNIRDLAYSPDGSFLACAGDFRHDGLAVHDALTGARIRTLTGRYAVAFSPDSTRLATDGQRIALYEVQSWIELRRLIGHKSIVSSLQFSRDGDLLLSGSFDGTMRLWDVASGRQIRKFRACGGWFRFTSVPVVYATTFSPDGLSALSAAADGTLRLWDLHEGRDQIVCKSRWSVDDAAFSPDGRFALAVTTDGAELWELAKNTRIGVFAARNAAAFTPDGKCLVVATGSTLALHDLSNIKSPDPIPHEPRRLNDDLAALGSAFWTNRGKWAFGTFVLAYVATLLYLRWQFVPLVSLNGLSSASLVIPQSFLGWSAELVAVAVWLLTLLVTAGVVLGDLMDVSPGDTGLGCGMAIALVLFNLVAVGLMNWAR